MNEEERPDAIDIIKANRRLITALLATPIFGMIIAIVLVLYKKPDNMFTVLAVIFFFMIQYGILIVYLNGRFDKL